MYFNNLILFYLKNYSNIPNRKKFLLMLADMKESSRIKKLRMRTGLIKFSFKQELVFNIPISSDFHMEYRFQNNEKNTNKKGKNTRLNKILLYIALFLTFLVLINYVFSYFFILCFSDILTSEQRFFVYKYAFQSFLPSDLTYISDVILSFYSNL